VSYEPWIASRLREAANITPLWNLKDLLFALADRAEYMEQAGANPMSDTDWNMVWAHATILAAGIVEEFKRATA
jgi:hypothetical protein